MAAQGLEPACAAIDFGGTVTDVVLRAPGRSDRLAAFPSISRPRPEDVERLLAETSRGQGDEPSPVLLAVTGGRSHELPDRISGIPLVKVPESVATAVGAMECGAPSPAIVVSLGTGTGIVLARPPEDPIRLVGSAVGGGTLLGLSRLLLGTTDVAEIGRLAAAGDVTRCDLTVGDIIGGGVGPISAEATAAHFARIGRPGAEVPARADIAAGLMNLIGQTALRLAYEAVLANAARSLVLVGHVLDVPGFREAIFRIPGMDPAFVRIPDDPGFAIARGALAVAAARRTQDDPSNGS
jgi:type II pantothenate kinase